MPARWSRERIERALGIVFKVFSILFFLLITAFPFYWMFNLSFRPFGDVLMNPLRALPRPEDFAHVIAPIAACWGGGGTEACQAAVRNSSYAAVL
ncbi:MAG: hypothetical protein D6770_04475, partial [Anaerolineae bacterium]